MDQIAVLKSVSFSNVLKIQAGKTKNKVANIFNKVSDKISNNVSEDSFLNYEFRFNQKEIKEMSDYLRDERKKLENKNRNTLNKLLKSELVKNIEIDKFDNKSIKNINEEELSKEMIHTAGRWKKLKIKNPDNLNIKSKAEVITNNFNSILIQQLSEVESKMENEDKTKTDKKIEKQLENMSEERREAIKNALNIDELSGEVLRKAILSSSGPLATIGIVNLSGFGAYIALTTVMNAIFTTALGVTLPFGVYTTATSGLALLAGPVGWLLVLGIGGRQFLKGKKTLHRILLTQAVWFSYNYIEYNVDEDDMPIWVPDRKKEKVNNFKEKENELKTIINSLEERKKEVLNEKEKISKELKNNDSHKESNHNIKVKKIRRKRNEKYINTLKEKWSELADLIMFAEDYLYNDPNTTMIKLRMFSEQMVDYIFMYETIIEKAGNNLCDKMTLLERNNLINRNIASKLHELRMQGNKAVHESFDSLNEAKKLIIDSYKLIEWFVQFYQ